MQEYDETLLYPEKEGSGYYFVLSSPDSWLLISLRESILLDPLECEWDRYSHRAFAHSKRAWSIPDAHRVGMHLLYSCDCIFQSSNPIFLTHAAEVREWSQWFSSPLWNQYAQIHDAGAIWDPEKYSPPWEYTQGGWSILFSEEIHEKVRSKMKIILPLRIVLLVEYSTMEGYDHCTRKNVVPAWHHLSREYRRKYQGTLMRVNRATHKQIPYHHNYQPRKGEYQYFFSYRNFTENG